MSADAFVAARGSSAAGAASGRAYKGAARIMPQLPFPGKPAIARAFTPWKNARSPAGKTVRTTKLQPGAAL